MIDFFHRLFGTSSKTLSSAGGTNTGRVRSHNEDGFCILPDRNIFAVADGMGGHNAGEVASQAALQTLEAFFSKDAVRKIKGNREEIRHFLIKGFHHVNHVVMKMAMADAYKDGMGCTMVGCMIDDGLLHTCHVGDARCYLANTRGMEQLTRDHSVIADYEAGISSDAASQSIRPPRQAVTRAIGFPFSEDPEYHSRPISPGHRILLCSDGLWSMVEKKQIHEVIISADATEKAANTLIQKANEAGGKDNITAVVIFC